MSKRNPNSNQQIIKECIAAYKRCGIVRGNARFAELTGNLSQMRRAYLSAAIQDEAEYEGLSGLRRAF